MSHSINVYCIEVQKNCIEQGVDPYNFIEIEENLMDFSEERLKLILEHLNLRGYKQKKKWKDKTLFLHPKLKSVEVSLYKNALFFNGRGDAIFDITMDSGEFTYYYQLKGNFAVFDSMNDGFLKIVE